MSAHAKDITGQRFGRLVALRKDGKTSNGIIFWLCQCDCGQLKRIRITVLNGGTGESCGCLQKELAGNRLRIHGMSQRTVEYAAWCRMRVRCLDQNSEDFHHYGGRGITICAQWRDFTVFLRDMGLKPTPKHSLERIDVNGNYEPTNCKWATAIEQRHNRRDPVSDESKARKILAEL